ncbi:Na+/H+ antiporter [Dactylosporangium darangshiense]|uniref:Na+/H+ antiporter n=1 Tax=Dactylosporangium darangshiense TaxID=579108 RepID=A0ABP8DKJ3_9ACTN
MQSVETVLALVVVATVVAVSARRLRLPAPSLLVAAGVAVGLLPFVPRISIDPQVVSLVVLPPLLYAAGEDLSWRELRRVWRPVTVLAFGLVLASAAAVGVVAAAVTGLPASMAFVLGAILASTDPVAVTALGRRLPLPARVHTLLQGESLFNDATSLVLFRVAVAGAAAGGALSWQRAAGQFVLLAGGGAAIGAAVAACVAVIRRRTEDPVLETVIALLTPYVAYVAAEAVHVSGVTAVVVASVILGGLSASLTNPGIRLQLHAVYGTVVFLLESVVFAVIGLTLPGFVADVATRPAVLLWQVVAIAGTMLAVRFLWVAPLAAFLSQAPRRRLAWRTAVVVSWAGARGVLPLAAALSLPLLTDAGTGLPGRELVITLTAAVIVLTLTAQGFTLSPLVRRSGIAASTADVRAEEVLADVRTARAALARLDELDVVPPEAEAVLRKTLRHRIDEHRDPSAEHSLADVSLRAVRRELIAAELRELDRLHAAGEISDATRRRLQLALDRRDSALGEP